MDILKKHLYMRKSCSMIGVRLKFYIYTINNQPLRMFIM